MGGVKQRRCSGLRQEFGTRSPTVLFGSGAWGRRRAEAEGQGFSGCVAFWGLCLGGFMKRGCVLLAIAAAAVAGACAPKVELYLVTVLPKLSQGLQRTLSSQKLPLGISQSLDEDITARLACRRQRKQ